VAKYNFFSQLSLLKRLVVFLLLPLLLLFTADVFANADPIPCADNHQAVNKTLHRIENEWPLRSSGDEVTQYIQKLGVHLAQLKGYANAFKWQFSVIRNISPNAFSIGDGYVFVTEGAINFAESESELVAILAHEIGHELAGHFCTPQTSNTIFDDVFKPKPDNHRIGVGSLTQVIDVAKEQQADRIALSIIQEGGYDPKAMLTFARRLTLDVSTHLIDPSRIQALEKAIADLPAQPAQSSNEFLAIKRIIASH
jgi:predicted Zn-dependent protease